MSTASYRLWRNAVFSERATAALRVDMGAGKPCVLRRARSLPLPLGCDGFRFAPELPCGDGVFTDRALEDGKAVHHFDGVMSHSFNRSPLSG